MRVIHVVAVAASILVSCLPASAELRVVQTCDAQAKACLAPTLTTPDIYVRAAIAERCHAQWKACLRAPYALLRRSSVPVPMSVPGHGWPSTTVPGRNLSVVPRLPVLPFASMLHIR